jgi:hypothetical protein
LGIGLFQSATMAMQNGFTLALAENREGAVRFVLGNAGLYRG